MGYKNWEQVGEELLRSIGDAIETGDFGSLNHTVSNTVNQAVDSVKNTFGGQNQSSWQGTAGQQGQSSYTQGTGQQGQSSYTQGNGQLQPIPSGQLYASSLSARAGGMLLTIGGFCGIAFFALGFLSLLFLMESPAAIIATALMAVGCFGIAYAGGRMSRLAQRFNHYVDVIGNREYCDVKQLAGQAGYPVSLVQKDLKKMIRRRWFKQGCLDASGNCLMVTRRAYQQYAELMKSRRQQYEEETARRQAQQRAFDEKRRQEDEAYAKFSPEVRKVLETGKAYIQKVHAVNDEIPGDEVSAKISRMELLLDRIFDRVERHPESADDLGRLLDYYLPMTMKLLEAYRDMDAQPVQSANIVSSKQEIEKTLDTLNTAFENLLNDLFEDMAWDLSTDISVLNTLLEQDGLGSKKL